MVANTGNIVERETHMSLSRRRLITSAAAVPLVSIAEMPAAGLQKIVVTGGHPGDPECGCAGTIVRYTDLGHTVVLLYMNRGQGYCGAETDLSRCGSIRTAEALHACEILKARAAFAAQIDGHAIVDNSHYQDFDKTLEAENPDVVFTHWPVDNHRDHRAISMLTLDAWLRSGKKFALYYYEVADDTMMFSPAQFVDISAVESRRRAACYAHASQLPDKWYPAQTEITRFRGIESGYPQAEAFLRHWQSKSAVLP